MGHRRADRLFRPGFRGVGDRGDWYGGCSCGPAELNRRGWDGEMTKEDDMPSGSSAAKQDHKTQDPQTQNPETTTVVTHEALVTLPIETVARLDRMATASMLATGLAHEIANPLSCLIAA